jgi:hypothetical protein
VCVLFNGGWPAGRAGGRFSLGRRQRHTVDAFFDARWPGPTVRTYRRLLHACVLCSSSPAVRILYVSAAAASPPSQSPSPSPAGRATTRVRLRHHAHATRGRPLAVSTNSNKSKGSMYRDRSATLIDELAAAPAEIYTPLSIYYDAYDSARHATTR